MFASICEDDRHDWQQQKARLGRARALGRKYIWDLQTEILKATIQEPQDQQQMDSLLLELAAAIARAQQRTGS